MMKILSLYSLLLLVVSSAATIETSSSELMMERGLTGGGIERVDDDGNTIVEYFIDGVDENSATASNKDSVFVVEFKITEVECGPIGSNTTVKMAFRAYMGPACLGDIAKSSAVMRNLKFTYDFGETAYVHEVDDSEAPFVGTYNTSKWYTALENYTYKQSSTYNTVFGFGFMVEDPECSNIVFPVSKDVVEPMYMSEDECHYKRTPSPTPAPSSPTSSSPTSSAVGRKAGYILHCNYYLISTMIFSFMISYAGLH